MSLREKAYEILTRQNVEAILNLNKNPDRRNRGIGILFSENYKPRIRKILLEILASRALINRVLWTMVHSDFSEANHIISRNFIVRENSFATFLVTEK